MNSRYIALPPERFGEVAAVERLPRNIPADSLREADAWVSRNCPDWEIYCRATPQHDDVPPAAPWSRVRHIQHPDEMTDK